MSKKFLFYHSLILLGLSGFCSAQAQTATLSGKIINHSSHQLQLKVQGGATGKSWDLPVSPLGKQSSYKVIGTSPIDPKYPFINAPFRIADTKNPGSNYCDFGIEINSSLQLEYANECTGDVQGFFGAC